MGTWLHLKIDLTYRIIINRGMSLQFLVHKYKKSYFISYLKSHLFTVHNRLKKIEYFFLCYDLLEIDTQICMIQFKTLVNITVICLSLQNILYHM